MDSGFKMELLLEYSKIFDDEPKLEDLLSGIGRNTLRKIAVFFLGFDNQNSKFHDPKEFIKMLFGRENNGFANDVYDKVKAYQKQTQAKIIIPYTLTSLTLFQHAFQHLDENETLTEAEIEVNVFKACLLINEIYTTKAHKASDTVKSIKEDNHLSELIFTMFYADSDLINFDPNQILTAQMIKSIMLFEMLEQDERATKLLKAFLDHFECANWKDYLKRVLPAVLPCIQKTNEAHIDIVLEKNEHYDQSIQFFDKLIISDAAALLEHDFTSVRANPIYQVDELTYRIVFPLFAMEMLHKGLYFKLSDINKSLTKAEGAFSDLRSYYCENFSENYLLYETMQRMYENRYKKYTGQQMKDAGLVAEPDYYVRNGKKIFLFESKDVLIRADIKASFDYTQLEQALKEKFYVVDKGNGKIKKKAILQILNSVKNTLDKALIVDTQYNESHVVIYPILVVHNHQFDISGLNNILKEWFNEELKNLEGYDVSGVKPLTLINIDDLLYYQDLFRNKQVTLEELIEGYYEHTTFNKKKQYKSQSEADEQARAYLVPFSTFASQYVKKKNLRTSPNILKEKGLSLFN